MAFNIRGLQVAKMAELPVLRLSLALLCLASYASAVEFKVLVAVEEPWADNAFIQAAFDRRVNLNWRVLQPHQMKPVILRVKQNQATEIERNVCEAAASGALGLLAVGGCPFLSAVGNLAGSLLLPFIAVPTDLCRMRVKNFGFVAAHDPSDLIDAAVSVLKVRLPNSVAIYYDNFQDTAMLEEVEWKLTSLGISSLTFAVNAANATSLTGHMQRLVKNKVRSSLVMTREANLNAVLSSALDAAVMQPNYFWTILDTDLTQAALLARAIPNSNIALVHGGAFGMEKAGSCPEAVLDVFPVCNVTAVRISEVRFVDSVEALAKALNDSLQTRTIAPSNLSCLAKQNWTYGRLLDDAIGSISGYDTLRGRVSFNSSTRFFNGQGVDVFGTWNEGSRDPPVMRQSAIFSLSSRDLSILAIVRGQKLVYPNTFLGFKNETLVVCSPFAPPYTYHVQYFPNKTVILGGMTRDLLDMLAQKMEFRYITKDSNDGTFGIVPSGSIFASGCVGEVQNGTVTFGGGPFGKSVNRAAAVEFSAAFFEESIAILVHRPPPASKLWNLLMPFKSSVWITLGVSIIFASLVIWLLAYFSPFTAWNLRLEYAYADEIWFQEYLWTIVGSLLVQGQDFYPFAMSPRTVMAFWWMFSVIILAVYTGDLASDLVVTNEVLSIKTLQDLADSDTVIPAVGVGSYTWNQIQGGGRTEYAKLINKLVTFQGPRGCRNMVLSSNIACLIDFTFATVVYNQFCDQVYLGEETFNTLTVGFIWQPDSYFADLFNFHIQRLYEEGFMWRSFLSSANSSFGCGGSKSLPPGQPVSLEASGACFIIIGGCIMIGLILLCLELLWVRVAKKNPLDFWLY